MQHALLHAQRVDERLQRRTRRALGVGTVHLPLDRPIVIVRRSHQRTHPISRLSTSSTAAFWMPRLRLRAINALTCRSTSRCNPASNVVSTRVSRCTSCCVCWRSCSIKCGAIGHLLRLPQRQRQAEQRLLAGVGGVNPLPALEQTVARLRQCSAEHAGFRLQTVAGRLRQHRQRQRLRQGQILRRLGEIDQLAAPMLSMLRP